MKKLAIALCLATTVFAQDPCSQTTKLNANAQGAQSWNGTKGATTLGGSGDDAYGVEAWAEAGGGQTKLTWYGPNQGGGFAFRAEWTNSEDYLGRFGYFWGTNGKKWNQLGDLCVDYNYTRSANGTGGSYSYIGVYGWTIGSNNSAEFYIVEDWFGQNQQTASNLGNCQTHGNITVDGKTYQVVTCVRPQGSGCVGCNNQAFGQVFSVRQGMRDQGVKTCGTISIKKHFEEWTKMGGRPAQYIYDKTYEAKFLAEAQAGTGWFDASYMKFSRTGCGGGSTPSSSSTGTASSSSRASSSSMAAASPTCNDYQASFCGGIAWSSVSGGSATMPTEGQCLYIGDFDKIQPNLSSTVAINGVENTCGTEWGEEEGKCPFNAKPAAKDGGYYVYVKTGTINSYQNNGWQGIVAKPKPTCSAPPVTPSSSSGGDPTPIANPSQLTNSHAPSYYTLKGEPLGNVKPQKAGVYIIKEGHSVKKIAVR